MNIENIYNIDNIIHNLDNNTIRNEFFPKNTIKKYNKVVGEKLLDYNVYFKNNVSLSSYKVPELKKIAKYHNIFVTGTKTLLIERITALFNKTRHCIKIQKCFRGSIVRYSMKLRGPAFKNRKLCVNDTDFITMEPIDEISNENFYSYTDEKNFTYGFDISSLIQCLNKKGKLENPYNREKMVNSLKENIKTLYKLSFIIFPEFKKNNEKLTEQRTNNQPTNNRNSLTNYIYTHDQQNRIIRLIENRNNTLDQRIINIFLEIDQLGNYTQLIWFNSLNTNGFIRLYRHLYDIWYLRSQMSREIRYNICPFPTVFPERNVIDLEYTQVKSACVEVFENLVFTGVDDEYRKIGAFHALTALTVVSSGAREALPWLYESIAIF